MKLLKFAMLFLGMVCMGFGALNFYFAVTGVVNGEIQMTGRTIGPMMISHASTPLVFYFSVALFILGGCVGTYFGYALLKERLKIKG
jgi:hypothetical protein